VAEPLFDRLDVARQAFLDALEEVDADLVTVPGVMEDWSVRDIVVHVAAWCEHASNAIDLAVAGLDPALLPLRLGNGDTVEEVIAYDGPDHYAEHTEHLRAWFAADEDDEADNP
jgi:hypothetical protein